MHMLPVSLNSSTAATSLQILTAVTHRTRLFIPLVYSNSNLVPISRMATVEKGTPQQQRILSSLARLTGSGHDQQKTNVEFIYMSNPSWPISGGMTAGSLQKAQRPIKISVLDSSFNPPTKAHLALASSPPPRSKQNTLLSPQWAERGQDEGSFFKDIITGANSTDLRERETYDAHMLLLSVTNADKKLKHGDATYLQRL